MKILQISDRQVSAAGFRGPDDIRFRDYVIPIGLPAAIIIAAMLDALGFEGRAAVVTSWLLILLFLMVAFVIASRLDSSCDKIHLTTTERFSALGKLLNDLRLPPCNILYLWRLFYSFSGERSLEIASTLDLIRNLLQPENRAIVTRVAHVFRSDKAVILTYWEYRRIYIALWTTIISHECRELKV